MSENNAISFDNPDLWKMYCMNATERKRSKNKQIVLSAAKSVINFSTLNDLINNNISRPWWCLDHAQCTKIRSIAQWHELQRRISLEFYALINSESLVVSTYLLCPFNNQRLLITQLWWLHFNSWLHLYCVSLLCIL